MAKKPTYTWTDKKTGLLYALYTYTDRFGIRRYVKRRARNIQHAREIYKQLENERKTKGEEFLQTAKMTFDQLADYAEKHYVRPPVYAEDRKVGGMRSWKDARNKLDVLRRYFGHMKVRDITAEDLKEFKELRLKTRTKRRAPRKIASVNREMSLLRRVINIAFKKRWIPFSPFEEGQLISVAEEVKRTRVISREEEGRLLAACNDPRREHLRPVIICGIDTGMRSGEMFKLRWRDVSLRGRYISISAFNTKSESPRDVPISARLALELERLWQESTKDKDALVFGVSRIKRGWTTACRLAGVRGATPHDLRHTAATRMIRQGVELAEVARILGHASVKTTYRYVNVTPETIGKAMEAIDRFNEEEHKEPREVIIQAEAVS